MLKRRIFAASLASVLALSSFSAAAFADENEDVASKNVVTKAQLKTYLESDEIKNLYESEADNFGTIACDNFRKAYDHAMAVVESTDDITSDDDATVALFMLRAAKDKLVPHTSEELKGLIDGYKSIHDNQNMLYPNSDVEDNRYTEESYTDFEMAYSDAESAAGSTDQRTITDAYNNLEKAQSDLEELDSVTKSEFRKNWTALQNARTNELKYQAWQRGTVENSGTDYDKKTYAWGALYAHVDSGVSKIEEQYNDFVKAIGNFDKTTNPDIVKACQECEKAAAVLNGFKADTFSSANKASVDTLFKTYQGQLVYYYNTMSVETIADQISTQLASADGKIQVKHNVNGDTSLLTYDWNDYVKNTVEGDMKNWYIVGKKVDYKPNGTNEFDETSYKDGVIRLEKAEYTIKSDVNFYMIAERETGYLYTSDFKTYSVFTTADAAQKSIDDMGMSKDLKVQTFTKNREYNLTGFVSPFSVTTDEITTKKTAAETALENAQKAIYNDDDSTGSLVDFETAINNYKTTYGATIDGLSSASDATAEVTAVKGVLGASGSALSTEIAAIKSDVSSTAVAALEAAVKTLKDNLTAVSNAGDLSGGPVTAFTATFANLSAGLKTLEDAVTAWTALESDPSGVVDDDAVADQEYNSQFNNVIDGDSDTTTGLSAKVPVLNGSEDTLYQFGGQDPLDVDIFNQDIKGYNTDGKDSGDEYYTPSNAKAPVDTYVDLMLAKHLYDTYKAAEEGVSNAKTTDEKKAVWEGIKDEIKAIDTTTSISTVSGSMNEYKLIYNYFKYALEDKFEADIDNKTKNDVRAFIPTCEELYEKTGDCAVFATSHNALVEAIENAKNWLKAADADRGWKANTKTYPYGDKEKYDTEVYKALNDAYKQLKKEWDGFTISFGNVCDKIVSAAKLMDEDGVDNTLKAAAEDAAFKLLTLETLKDYQEEEIEGDDVFDGNMNVLKNNRVFTKKDMLASVNVTNGDVSTSVKVGKSKEGGPNKTHLELQNAYDALTSAYDALTSPTTTKGDRQKSRCATFP